MEIGKRAVGVCDFIAQLIIWKDLIPSLLERAWPISHLPYTCVVTCKMLVDGERRGNGLTLQLTEENFASSVLRHPYHTCICLYTASSALYFNSQEIPPRPP